jgi:hypothetical protein
MVYSSSHCINPIFHLILNLKTTKPTKKNSRYFLGRIVVKVDSSISEKVITSDAAVKPITSISKSQVDVSLLDKFMLKEIKKTTYGTGNDSINKPLSYATVSSSYKNDSTSTGKNRFRIL